MATEELVSLEDIQHGHDQQLCCMWHIDGWKHQLKAKDTHTEHTHGLARKHTHLQKTLLATYKRVIYHHTRCSTTTCDHSILVKYR